MSNWFIRPYQPGDEIALIDLFQRVFGRSITSKHWLWKLKELPSAIENVWVVQDGEKLVGQYAAMPMLAQLNKQVQPIMVSVDTMVDPDYRRQGMLTTMGEQIYQKWAEAGVAYVIGLPNEKWGSRTQQLGWQPLFPLQWLGRPLRPEAYLARRLRLPLLSRITLASKVWNGYWSRVNRVDTAVSVYEVQEAGPAFDTLWQACRVDTHFSVVRDRQWVQWRFLSSPSLNYQMLLATREGKPIGYGVYRLQTDGQRSVGFLTELVTAPNDSRAFDTLLQAIGQRLLAVGADMVVTQVVPATERYSQWRRSGFYPRRAAFMVQMVPLAADLPLATMQEPQNWMMSGADFDVA